jgi:predicted nucleic acid-binding protein
VSSPPGFIDSNIIVRYVAADHPDHSPRAKAYLEGLDEPGKQAHILEGVIIESINVLTSPKLYALDRAAAAAALSDILSLRGIKIPNKRTYLDALRLYGATRLDFVDALNVTHARRKGVTIVSFDHDYDKVLGATRVGP